MSRTRNGRTTNRGGSVIIEAVIGLVLLATATIALTKLAQSSAALGRQSDQRLTATLAAENAIERLRGVAIEDLADQSAEIADLVAEDTGCGIDVVTETFNRGNRSGIHLRVDASISAATRIRLHSWRFESASNGESEPATDDTSADGDEDDSSANGGEDA